VHETDVASGAAAVLKRYPTWLSARADEVIE